MTLEWPDRPRILLSFAYRKSVTVNDSLAYLGGADVMIDSGAFTAFTQGKAIDMAEYTEWILKERQRITHAAALDVIGDWKASARNYERMLSIVGDRLHVVPAWHIGSPLSELLRLCKEAGYVAIGGCVPYAKRPKLLMRHLVQAHKVAQSSGAKLHGLGVTGRTTMTQLPWRSVDSSSWQTGHQYGNMSLAGRAGEFVAIPFSRPLTLSQSSLVRAYGGNPARVAAPNFNLVGKDGNPDRARSDRTWVNMAAARSFMYVEGVLRRRHRSGLTLYLATPQASYATEAVDAHKLGSPYPNTREATS